MVSDSLELESLAVGSIPASPLQERQALLAAEPPIRPLGVDFFNCASLYRIKRKDPTFCS